MLRTLHSVLGIVTALRYLANVLESADDIETLKALLEGSGRGAGDHLRNIFRPERQPTAREVVEALPGIFEMHFATVTSDGALLVAPLDGIFYKGQVWFGIPAGAVRARLVRRDPRVSASYTAGDFAFIVHGTAVEVTGSDDRSREYESLVRGLYVAEYGPGWVDWYRPQRGRFAAGWQAIPEAPPQNARSRRFR